MDKGTAIPDFYNLYDEFLRGMYDKWYSHVEIAGKMDCLDIRNSVFHRFFIGSKSQYANNIVYWLWRDVWICSRICIQYRFKYIKRMVPDKQGSVSGILLMGFGLSSFLVGKIYQKFTMSGVGIDEWRRSFQIFGIIILLVFLICGFWLVKPEKKRYRKLYFI